MTPLLDRFRSLLSSVHVMVYAVPNEGGFLFYVVFFRDGDIRLTEEAFKTLASEYPQFDLECIYFTPEDWECVVLPRDAVWVCGRVEE